MKRNRTFKIVRTLSIGLVVFLLICWDFATTDISDVYSGSFRFESEFTKPDNLTILVILSKSPISFFI